MSPNSAGICATSTRRTTHAWRDLPHRRGRVRLQGIRRRPLPAPAESLHERTYRWQPQDCPGPLRTVCSSSDPTRGVARAERRYPARARTTRAGRARGCAAARFCSLRTNLASLADGADVEMDYRRANCREASPPPHAVPAVRRPSRVSAQRALIHRNDLQALAWSTRRRGMGFSTGSVFAFGLAQGLDATTQSV
jgi:hypothetical protein